VAVMNNRRRALIASASRMILNADEMAPAQRWASSAMARSKAGASPSRKASAIFDEDW
jgi:hypothetical protein